MSKLKFVIAAAVCAAAFTVGDAPAVAATQTADLAVSATVINNCTITAGTLAFGNYDALTTNATTDLDQTGTFTISCTQGTPYTITLDAGTHAASAVGTTRAMASGTNFLNYEIYVDSGRTKAWNTTTNTLTGTGAGVGAANVTTITAYGRVPQGQNANVGSYTDTVVETVTF